MAFNKNWVCPYCGHAQVVSKDNYERHWADNINDRSEHGLVGSYVVSISCANEDCKKLTLSFGLTTAVRVDFDRQEGELIQAWPLLPESSAKPQPDYIPAHIVDNYNQACRIRDLSANASATMARRCLQGMIREFCGISEKTLYAEIETLKKQVEDGKAAPGVLPDVVDAIHSVREMGNIGAHMQGDINLIVDVESDEAQTLIELIELLFKEWYVAKHERERRLTGVGSALQNKNKGQEEEVVPGAENA